MPINTYSSLSTAVTSFAGQTGNVEFTDQVGNMIELGEADVYRNLRHPRMILSQSFSAPAPYPVPVDLLEVSLVHHLGAILPYTNPEDLLVSADGTPTMWSILGEEFRFDGAPTVDTVVFYYAKPPKLRDATTNNNIFLLNPDLFLYAALSHAMIFLRDEQRQQIWASLFKQKLDEINAAAWSSGVPKQQPLTMRTS